jgi:hypothetical protein
VLYPAVVAAAVALGVRPEALRPLEGASGRTWNAGEHVMRVGDAVSLDVETIACGAAAGVMAVPEVLDRVDFEGFSAVLLRRLSGTPAGKLEGVGASRARRRGSACGRLHATLARVVAPVAVPPVEPEPAASLLDRPRGLLHLDLHPFNVLVDADDEVSGVLDWANAAAGDPLLDRSPNLQRPDPRPSTPAPWPDESTRPGVRSSRGGP